jgi:hypothetical protein
MFELIISVTLLINGEMITQSNTQKFNSLETCQSIQQIAEDGLQQDSQDIILGYSVTCK